MKKPVIEEPAVERAKLASDTVGELHFEDTGDYIKFVSGAVLRSSMKYKDVASGGGMSPSTVSNMASGKTKYPRFGTMTGILGTLGYEMLIRGGKRRP